MNKNKILFLLMAALLSSNAATFLFAYSFDEIGYVYQCIMEVVGK